LNTLRTFSKLAPNTDFGPLVRECTLLIRINWNTWTVLRTLAHTEQGCVEVVRKMANWDS